ncbi:MAG: RNA polymerase sigma-70 factor [Tannerella sp.]|jgi:RNA polymerase sigma-70 factor (ECF subfamily)|nr:RNA polymerase sigma-70 factor [Tannerella sp.]
MNEETQRMIELASGSHEAYKVLFLKYFPRVKYFINHLIKSEAIAEELSQDVFMKVWEFRERMLEVKSFNSYVFRMAKNEALNHLDHRLLEKRYAELYRSEAVQTEDNGWEAKEIGLLEQLTVDRMPPQRKRVYEMSRMDGLSHAEIATRLGISKKTVENHLTLALKELNKILYIITLFFG